MKIAVLAALMLFATSAGVAAPSVSERSGNIVYMGKDGARTLTRNGNNADPALSPDGRTIAFVHFDTGPSEDRGVSKTSLWVADVATGATHRLAGPSFGATYEQWMGEFRTPIFSLDSRSIYVSANASEVSCMVHRIDIATRRDRFIIDGCAFKIVLTGPYRGALLVSRHKYLAQGGSYNPVDLVLPSGKVALTVPGTHWGGDEADRAIARWLKKHGWKAA